MANWVISRGSTVGDFVSGIRAPSERSGVAAGHSPISHCGHNRPAGNRSSAGRAVSACDRIDKINDFSRQRKCRVSHLSGPKKSFDIVPHGKLSA